MQIRVLVGLMLLLSSCSRVAIPGVPNAFQSGDQKAKNPSKNAEIYSGDDGALGGIGGTLPSDTDMDPLEMGNTDLPKMDDPVTKMPDEEPKETDPKDIPSDPGSDPRSFRTLSVVPSENRGVWEGFGITLGSWANAVGASDFQDTYADIFFTQKNTAFTNTVLPGLGLNIVRYAIGGGGREGDDEMLVETNPKDFAAYRDIDGFWIDSASEDLSSQSFDWTRDANQRSMLTAAKDRGIKNFEFYALAPMWWMTTEKTSVGGHLESSTNYAKYLASVVQYARSEWAIPVSSLAPFNEPSSDRWKTNVVEEGVNLDTVKQAEILGELQKEFLSRELDSLVSLSGSDEANPRAGLNTHEGLKREGSDVYEKLNVHTADRGRASRDVNSKEGLRIAAGEKRIWVSDHSDNESDGMSLATSIVEDINAMKATAWIYGQAVDVKSTRGLLYGNFDMTSDVGVRGKPTAISVKHFILAQFSRFIRPGQQIVGGSDDKSLIAYDPTSHRLSVIILNTTKTQQDVDVDLSAFKSFSSSITHVVSRGDGMKVWKAKSVGVFSRKIRVNVEAGSVSSVEIPDALLN